MQVPKNLWYTEEHEWVKVEGEIATIGITEYAQGELGDVVFVELPQVGAKVQQMQAFGTIEAVKAVSDLFAPVSGEVAEVNALLSDQPEVVNQDPYGQGWMIRIKMSVPQEVKKLLSAEDYEKKVG
ncbi:MAG TPA: glycine cleavage system protein GcvH [bacterium]|jgi:glycine cleavage system H protein|nr:glycine cleavage system protein GcvH [bacterium]HNT64569.1 glycine cleavage system protein GcvH [bacterium]HOX84588.1 glycine cleavage system protein GcvH [bacterium]HPG45311.1 glycine cleavage system protein GcvH [bacterium]HPM98970.1 glycine cleavage system protein GcvH [bacterium]